MATSTKSKLKSFAKSNMIFYALSIRLLRLRNKYKKPILGKNNSISNKGVMINVKYDIVGSYNSIQIERGAVLSDMTIYIRGNNHKLILGVDSRFSGGELWFEDESCEINIGKYTTIESAHLAVTEPNSKITIGEDCMFSGNIEFRTGDSHSILDNTTRLKINEAEDIKVGNHVWIGAHSIILKGIEIGDNCIIGTKSIVTKDIHSNSIAAGVPARVVKENVDWARERYYNS